MFEKYPDILSVKQMMKALQISKNTAYDLLRNGNIKAVRLNKKWLIPKNSLIDFVTVK